MHGMFPEHAWSTFLCLNVFERFWSHLIHLLLLSMVSDNFSWTNPTALKKNKWTDTFANILGSDNADLAQGQDFLEPETWYNKMHCTNMFDGGIF